MLIDIITPTIPIRSAFLNRLKACVAGLSLTKDIKVNHIIINESKSAGAHRNLGLLKSTGDYIYYIDDDDILLHNFISDSLVNLMLLEKKLIVFKTERYFQPDENNIHHIVPDNFSWDFGKYTNVIQMINVLNTGNNPYPVGSYLIHKSLKNILWPETTEFGEDIKYNKSVLVELAKVDDKINFINEIKAIIVRHNKSTTYQARNMNWWKEK